MKEGTPVQQHLKRMKELADQLAAIGAAIPVEDQMVTLLGSLPPSYSTLVTALEAQVDDLTLQFVQQALINEEQKQTGGGGVAEASAGRSAMLYHAQSNTGSDGANKAFKKVKCYSCGLFGHTKRNCPNLKQPEGRKSVHKAKNKDIYKKVNVQHLTENVDAAEEECSDPDAGTVFGASIGFVACREQGHWLIDSGASRHMTSDKELLINYHQFDF